MKANYFSIISKCLMGLMLLFTVASCSDDDNGIDNSPLTLVACTPENGGNVTTDGTIELTFSKDVRQAPDTQILLNGEPVRIIITDNVVRVHYSFPLADQVTLDIPAGALTDINGVNSFEGINLRYEIMMDKRLYDAVVDINGNGDYTSIQKAIDNAPSKGTAPYLIFVANGVYKEWLNITKPYIHLIGQDVEKTIVQFTMCRVKTEGDPLAPLAWDYSSQNPEYQAKTGLTSSQESLVLIKGSDFHAENISFVNTFGARVEPWGGLGANGQADAMMTRADRISFYNCKMVSFQDTWWVRHNDKDGERDNRNYADHCWIEGKTDYVYGNGNLLIENSTFFNVTSGSVMTAGSNYPSNKWGHVMRNCTVDGLPEADGTVFLGRPWQQEPRTLWINTTLNIGLGVGHWTDMGVLPKLYAEYNTVDKGGNLVSVEDNIKKEYMVGGVNTLYEGPYVLSDTQAAEYSYDKVSSINSIYPLVSDSRTLSAAQFVSFSLSNLA
ncbi:pectinesterase family protein, partial [uncultured Bacteroides sp.]|uniref:pectinesterase family protein n=1 Tax=uncultured Bacteroides sp. TaxID=162156 RepID=UPI002624BC0B